MAVPEKSPATVRVVHPTPAPAIHTGRRAASTAQQSLALDVPVTAELRPAAGRVGHHLWLCLHLPYLPLEVSAAADPAGARAVFEDQQGLRKVLLANARAAAGGIGPGLSVNAALALMPALCLQERNPLRERQVLKELAGWAEQFTSRICIEMPALLLLEIAGSLRLFGGLDALRQGISGDLEQRGFTVITAIAPTPLAATWLARAGCEACIREARMLAGALSRLPLACLDWPPAIVEALRGMGIGSVGDCLRLPRQGFARRFGATRLLQLDRALGHLPDPRRNYRTPEVFVREYDLMGEQSDSELLLHACRELLLELERFLLSRQLTVQRLRFSFFHLQIRATHLTLGCAQADRSIAHWCELLAIKFDRLELPAPVITIGLRGGRGQPLSAVTGRLSFSRAGHSRRDDSITQLVERLGARIGNESIHGLTAVAEHRPQRAWRPAAAFDEPPQCQALPGFWYERRAPQLLAELRRNSSLLLRRPLWMLPEPKPLETEKGMPFYQGALTLLDGPERLETGWWDDDGIARDYFVALNPAGVYLWIFRSRRRVGGWFVHGIFA